MRKGFTCTVFIVTIAIGSLQFTSPKMTPLCQLSFGRIVQNLGFLHYFCYHLAIFPMKIRRAFIREANIIEYILYLQNFCIYET